MAEVVEDYSKREPVLRSVFADVIEQWSDEQWYFWDETWTTAYGPFSCEDAARDACTSYVKMML